MLNISSVILMARGIYSQPFRELMRLGLEVFGMKIGGRG